MSRLFPALCVAATVAAIPSVSFAQSSAPNLSGNPSNPIVVAAASARLGSIKPAAGNRYRAHAEKAETRARD